MISSTFQFFWNFLLPFCNQICNNLFHLASSPAVLYCSPQRPVHLFALAYAISSGTFPPKILSFHEESSTISGTVNFFRLHLLFPYRQVYCIWYPGSNHTTCLSPNGRFSSLLFRSSFPFTCPIRSHFRSWLLIN